MKSSEIEGLLPDVFRRGVRPGSVLSAILGVMEAQHAPDEAALQQLPSHFNAYRAPDEFVPYLARWVDLGRVLADETQELAWYEAPLPSSGLGRLRELIAAAAHLSRWRGTAAGLVLFLETATGVPGFAVDERVPGEDGLARPFHVRVRAPAAAKPFAALVQQIVEMEKPAYVTYEVQFA